MSIDEEGGPVILGWFVRKEGTEVRIAKTEHNSLVSVLDGLGAEGWEAVSYAFVAGVIVLLKRQA